MSDAPFRLFLAIMGIVVVVLALYYIWEAI